MLDRLLILLCGLIVYKLKPSWLFFYGYTIVILLLPFFAANAGVTDIESLNALRGQITSMVCYVYLICYIIELSHKRSVSDYLPKQTVFSCTLVCIYVLLSNIFNDGDANILRLELTNYINLCLPVLLFSINKKIIPSKRSLLIFFSVIFVVEFITVLVNYNGIYLFTASYTSFEGKSHSPISGTFFRYNALSNFITTWFLFFSIWFYNFTNRDKRIYLFITIAVFLIILLSGARASIIMFVVVVGLSLFFFSHYNKAIIVSCFCLLFLLTKISITDATISEDLSNIPGLERIISGLQDLFKNESDRDNMSTTSLTTYLLTNWGDKSPIFGNARSYMGEGAYGYINTCGLQAFKSDARLAYLFIEYGIVGFLIIIFYLYSIVKETYCKSTLNKKIFTISFLYYSLLTITEIGFFDTVLFNLFPIVLFALNSKESNR